MLCQNLMLEGINVNEIMIPIVVPRNPKHALAMAGGVAAVGASALVISAILRKRINKKIVEKQHQLKLCKDKVCMAKIKKEIYNLKQRLLPAEKRDLPADVQASIDKRNNR